MRYIYPLILVLTLSIFAKANEKQAIIIGNDSYKTHQLDNAINDAQSIANALKFYGYYVQKIEDANKQEILKSLKNLNSNNNPNIDKTIFFYFSGHGFQYNGQNYIVPIDANIQNRFDLINQSINISEVFKAFKDDDKKIIIFDICRDDILAKEFPTIKWLGEMATPPNSLVAYSTSTGTVSYDDGEFRGVYAQALTHNLRSSDKTLSIQDIFNNTRKEVVKNTNGDQNPVEIYTLTEEIFLHTQTKRLPPNRYFTSLDLWRYSCPIEVDNINYELLIEIDPSQLSMRARTSKLSPEYRENFQKWSIRNNMTINKEKGEYFIENFNVHLSKNNKSKIISGSFSRKSNSLFLDLLDSNNQKSKILTLCSYIKEEHWSSKKDLLTAARIESELRNTHNELISLNEIRESFSNIQEINEHMRLIKYLPEKDQFLNLGLFLKDLNEEKYYEISYRLFLHAFLEGNRASALELSEYYFDNKSNIVEKDLSLAYDLAEVSRLGDRLDYWVTINKWGQTLLNEYGDFDLFVDGQVGPNTCRALATVDNWESANYECGDFFNKQTLLRLQK